MDELPSVMPRGGLIMFKALKNKIPWLISGPDLTILISLVLFVCRPVDFP